jgi:chaperonin GroES
LSAKDFKLEGLPLIKPLGDRIVLQVAKEEEKSVGGIVLASAAQEKPQTAEVIAVGAGRVLDNGNTVAPLVKVGDKVIFEKYAGVEIKIDGVEYLVVHEKDIVGILA